MELPRDQFFFHYTNREAAFEHILPRGQIRLSPYTRVNDPLENKPWLFPAAYFVDEESEEPHRPEIAYFEFLRGAQTIWESAKLLALTVDAPPEAGYAGSAEPFGRGWARARMWDQYAEGHKGVCLVFDREMLSQNLRRSLTGRGMPPPYHRAVDYTEEGPAGAILSLDPRSLGEKVTPRVISAYIEDHHDALFFLKTTDWQTEFEYRFVVTTPDHEFVHAEYEDALKAVIVGEAFPAWQRASACESCERVGVEALRLDWSMRRPVPATLKALGPEPSDLYAALTERLQREDQPRPPVP
jgi:hypothetical protein